MQDLSTSKPLPIFEIERLRACQDSALWISCEDVWKSIDAMSGIRHILAKSKKFHYVAQQTVNTVFNGKAWESVTHGETLWMLPMANLSEFIHAKIDSARKSVREKNEVLARFGLPVTIAAPIECELLEYLEKTSPFPVVKQFRISKYKVDCYIPRLHLAVQIDENDHKNYDEMEEREYDCVLREHNIVVLRFQPKGNDTHAEALRLVKLVWQRSVSPDLKTFLLVVP